MSPCRCEWLRREPLVTAESPWGSRSDDHLLVQRLRSQTRFSVSRDGLKLDRFALTSRHPKHNAGLMMVAVAPHAGAWIETAKDCAANAAEQGRAPRGRVD